MGVLVLVLCDMMECLEGIEVGMLKLIGINKENLIKEVLNLLDNKENYDKMVYVVNLYGDGFVVNWILVVIKSYFEEIGWLEDFIV